MKMKSKIISLFAVMMALVSNTWAMNMENINQKLHDIKRSIIWSEKVEEMEPLDLQNSLMRQYGIKEIDLGVTQSFCDCVLMVAAVDGLSEAEENAFREATNPFLENAKEGQYDVIKAYIEESIKKARSGKYRNNGLNELYAKYAKNVLILLGKDSSLEGFFSRAAGKVIIFGALEVSSADGLSQKEIEKAKSLSSVLGVNNESFNLIVDYVKLKARVRTGAGVEEEEISKFLEKASIKQ